MVSDLYIMYSIKYIIYREQSIRHPSAEQYMSVKTIQTHSGAI